MYCPKCGTPLNQGVNFCTNCGTNILQQPSNLKQTQQPIEHQQAVQTQTPSQTNIPPFQTQQQYNPYQAQGRGVLILTLGILSLIILGPILGIPAWVMGKGDLKKIQDGTISENAKSSTKTGMILGIIGTCWVLVVLLGIFLVVGINLSQSSSVEANRSAVVQDLNSISAHAMQYYKTSAAMGGGNGSFLGFTLSGYNSTANGSYSIIDQYYSSISIEGVGTEKGDDGTYLKMQVRVSSSGNISIIKLN